MRIWHDFFDVANQNESNRHYESIPRPVRDKAESIATFQFLLFYP
jgi:hypothetical protein